MNNAYPNVCKAGLVLAKFSPGSSAPRGLRSCSRPDGALPANDPACGESWPLSSDDTHWLPGRSRASFRPGGSRPPVPAGQSERRGVLHHVSHRAGLGSLFCTSPPIRRATEESGSSYRPPIVARSVGAKPVHDALHAVGLIEVAAGALQLLDAAGRAHQRDAVTARGWPPGADAVRSRLYFAALVRSQRTASGFEGWQARFDALGFAILPPSGYNARAVARRWCSRLSGGTTLDPQITHLGVVWSGLYRAMSTVTIAWKYPGQDQRPQNAVRKRCRGNRNSCASSSSRWRCSASRVAMGTSSELIQPLRRPWATARRNCFPVRSWSLFTPRIRRKRSGNGASSSRAFLPFILRIATAAGTILIAGCPGRQCRKTAANAFMRWPPT